MLERNIHRQLQSVSVPIDCLEKISILQDLTRDRLLSLGGRSHLSAYQPGEIVFCERDILLPGLYILFSGALHFTRTASNGKETLFRVLRTGDIFAAPALVGNCIAPATVRAISRSEAIVIERPAFITAVSQMPEVALRILAIYNQRLQQMHDVVYEMACERAIVRLIKLVRRQAEEYGVTQNERGDDCLKQNLSYYQMACSVGISYEECVRLIHRLKPMLRYQRGGKICVSDWLGLEKLCS